MYSDAAVLINPTYADTFPAVNIDAFACVTSVITYCTGGSPETVDLNTGAVVEQGNIDALCKKIKEFNYDKFKKNSTMKCRERAEKEFDKDKCFEKYMALYEQILKGN